MNLCCAASGATASSAPPGGRGDSPVAPGDAIPRGPPSLDGIDSCHDLVLLARSTPVTNQASLPGARFGRQCSCRVAAVTVVTRAHRTEGVACGAEMARSRPSECQRLGRPESGTSATQSRVRRSCRCDGTCPRCAQIPATIRSCTRVPSQTGPARLRHERCPRQ